MIFVWLIILALSIFVLVKAADYFTDHAQRFGKLIGLPSFLIGIVVLAVGTALPEFVTSIIAVAKGQTEFLSGNVLGNVIFNIFIILGLAALFARRKIKFSWEVIINDLPFLALAVFLVAVTLLDGVLYWGEAFFFVLGYVAYIIFNYLREKNCGAITTTEKKVERVFHLPSFGYTILSLGLVMLSSYVVVEVVEELADLSNVKIAVIGASLVAFGSALPEIIVAVQAFRKGNFDLALGDILGASIFNLFVIYGVAGFIRPLALSLDLYILMMVFLLFGVLLLWLTLVDKKLTKVESALFLVVYLLFILKLYDLI